MFNYKKVINKYLLYNSFVIYLYIHVRWNRISNEAFCAVKRVLDSISLFWGGYVEVKSSIYL
jgi:hypothetical protein